MHIEDIEYEVEGKRHIGHLAVDEATTGQRPAVLVCHEGPGLSDHAKNIAERLAGHGYVAFALDYHGGGQPLPREEMGPALGALMGDPDRIRRLARAGLDVLLAQPTADASRVAAIGFCFGGTMSLELARGGNDVAGVVGFHSGLGTARPEAAKNIKGKVLVLIGADDPGIGPDQRAAFETEMREGKVDWQMNLYGGVVHSYTNKDADQMGMPDFARYDRIADERSWAEMLAFFGELF